MAEWVQGRLDSSISPSPMNSITSSIDDQTRLVVGEEDAHHPLKILSALYSKVLTLVLILVAAFTMPIFYHESDIGLSTSSIMQYLHIGMWIKIMILTYYIERKQQRSRLIGYFIFYNTNHHYYHITFHVFSAGNVFLLFLSGICHDFCIGDSMSACSESVPLTPVNYQQIIICLEVAISLPFLVKYILLVVNFNASKAAPDVLNEEHTLSMERRNSEQFIGFQGPSCIDRVLDKQADMIASLQYRNNVLCHQVYVLAEQVQSHQQTL